VGGLGLSFWGPAGIIPGGEKLVGKRSQTNTEGREKEG